MNTHLPHRKGIIVVLAVLLFVASSCNRSNSSYSNGYEPNQETTIDEYQQAKLTVADRERDNPTDFLSSTGTYRKNLIGEWVLEGTIESTAREITYKDVVLEVVFYTKTETELGRDRYTVLEYVRPGKSVDFKIKTNGYQGTSSVGWRVVRASLK